jgi:hypothetical protein
MTSSRSSSSRRSVAALAAAVALAAALSACAGGRGAARHDAVPRPRVVLLPVENLSGTNASMREVQTAIEVALRRKFDVVSGDILEQFLSRHRLRFTGGVDPEIAVAAREELGADAILVSSLLSYRGVAPPVFGLTMRLVSAAERPTILWIDQQSFAGDESPGLLRLGVVDSLRVATVRVVDRLVRSLDLAMAGHATEPQCGGGSRYRPRVRFRHEVVPGGAGYTVAVVPFLNRTSRRGAGEIVALEFVRQLVDSGEYHVLEPGVVRQYMLRSRVIIPGGVSLETTRMFLGALEVDLVLAGTVLDYAEAVGPSGPTLRFTATLLEGRGGEVVWHSSSFNRGDDGVRFFGLGRVATPGLLMCRMVAPVVTDLLRASAGRSSLADVGASRREEKPDLRRLFQ